MYFTSLYQCINFSNRSSKCFLTLFKAADFFVSLFLNARCLINAHTFSSIIKQDEEGDKSYNPSTFSIHF